MTEWMELIQLKLESFFLHGKLSLRQYNYMANYAQSLILRVEVDGRLLADANRKMQIALQTAGCQL
jgi:hypothetical protein